MDNIKDDRYYIDKVIENIDTIISYTKDISYSEFVNNPLIIDATMFRLVQMVENIAHISKKYKDDHKNIKWGKIMGFRNGIVHDYGKVDYSIVYEILSSDILKLKNNLVEELINIK